MTEKGDAIAQKLGDGGIDKLVEIAGREGPPLPSGKIKPYRFGHDNLAALTDHNGVDLVNERFCRFAREELFVFLRQQPRIDFIQPDIETFANYRKDLDHFLSISTCYIRELRASCLLVMRANFVSLLTSAYFGGALEYGPADATEFTASEARVRDLCTKRLVSALKRSWNDITTLSIDVSHHEDKLQFLHFLNDQDPVLRSTFMIDLAGLEPALIEVVYPMQSLKAIAPQMRVAMQVATSDEDSAWRAQFERAILNIPLTAKAKLAEIDLPLARLVELKTGHVISLDVEINPRLLVEGAELFDVTPGQRGQRAAVSLDRRLATPLEEDTTP